MKRFDLSRSATLLNTTSHASDEQHPFVVGDSRIAVRSAQLRPRTSGSAFGFRSIIREFFPGLSIDRRQLVLSELAGSVRSEYESAEAFFRFFSLERTARKEEIEHLFIHNGIGAPASIRSPHRYPLPS